MGTKVQALVLIRVFVFSFSLFNFFPALFNYVHDDNILSRALSLCLLLCGNIFVSRLPTTGLEFEINGIKISIT